MKRTVLLILLSVMGVARVAYAEWMPPEKPNPSAIMREGDADAAAGRHELALEKYVWFFRNALVYDKAQYGVRLSFLLTRWGKLGEKYPPALAKMKEIRDECKTTALVGAREIASGAVRDLVALSDHLKEPQAIVDLFKALDEKRPELAKEHYVFAAPTLIRQKEYVLCAKYVDVHAEWVRDLEMLKTSRENPNYDRFGKSLEKSVVTRATVNTALLVKLKRENEARDFVSRALKEWDSAELKTGLERALKGEMPE